MTVGQTASLHVQLRHRRHDHRSPAGRARRRRPPPTSRSGSRNTGLPYRQYSYAPGTTTLTPLFPYPAGYTVFAGNCTDNNPVGFDTTRNTFYNNPGTSTVTVTPGGTTDDHGPAVRPADHGRRTRSGRRSSARRSPRPRRRRTRRRTRRSAPAAASSGTAPTLGLVTTSAAGTSTTAMPLGHWTINATARAPSTAPSRSGAASRACSPSRPPGGHRDRARRLVTVTVS